MDRKRLPPIFRSAFPNGRLLEVAIGRFGRIRDLQIHQITPILRINQTYAAALSTHPAMGSALPIFRTKQTLLDALTEQPTLYIQRRHTTSTG